MPTPRKSLEKRFYTEVKADPLDVKRFVFDGMTKPNASLPMLAGQLAVAVFDHRFDAGEHREEELVRDLFGESDSSFLVILSMLHGARVSSKREKADDAGVFATTRLSITGTRLELPSGIPPMDECPEAFRELFQQHFHIDTQTFGVILTGQIPEVEPESDVNQPFVGNFTLLGRK